MVIAAAALCVLLLLVFTARVVAALDEAELALRGMVGSLRAISRGARQVVPVADRIRGDVTAGERALGRLEALKQPAPGNDERPNGYAAQ